MSGSSQGLELEADMMRVMLEAISDDGLYYAKVGHGRPWHEGVGHAYPPVGEDFANTYGNARMLLALMAWHARNPDPVLWKRMAAMAHGLCDMAIDKGGYVGAAEVAFAGGNATVKFVDVDKPKFIAAARPAIDRIADQQWAPEVKGMLREIVGN
ncbi:MAG: hypothetical protein EHM71_17470 [Zetaproteobacteria bacterium]|nr:MAG: hypothetical protein EHM71_17470 [Zetaproteobacteria bacterium]